MTALNLTLTGAQVLLPEHGLVPADLAIADGVIQTDRAGGRSTCPVILFCPGSSPARDGFERHIAPRRGAMKQMDEGILSVEAELAANGITTAVLAQFHSWEGGVRGPEFADQVFNAIASVKDRVVTDLMPQLRFETPYVDDYADLPERHRGLAGALCGVQRPSAA